MYASNAQPRGEAQFIYGWKPKGGVFARTARQWTDADDRETAVDELIGVIRDAQADQEQQGEERGRPVDYSEQFDALIEQIERAATETTDDIHIAGPLGLTFYVEDCR